MPWSEWFLGTLEDEFIGLIGGAIFLGSLILQFWETRQAGRPMVSARFFMLRSTVSFLLVLEGWRAGSFSISAVMAAMLVLMLYNLKSAMRAEAEGR